MGGICQLVLGQSHSIEFSHVKSFIGHKYLEPTLLTYLLSLHIMPTFMFSCYLYLNINKEEFTLVYTSLAMLTFSVIYVFLWEIQTLSSKRKFVNKLPCVYEIPVLYFQTWKNMPYFCQSPTNLFLKVSKIQKFAHENKYIELYPIYHKITWLPLH